MNHVLPIIFLVICFAFAVLMLRNPANEDALKESTKVFGALALMWFAVAGSIRPESRFGVWSLEFFKAPELNQFVFGKKGSVYHRRFSFGFAGIPQQLSPNDQVSVIIKPEEEMDFVEKHVLATILNFFENSPFDSESQIGRRGHGTLGVSRVFSKSSTPQERLPISAVTQALKDNKFITPDGLYAEALNVPVGTEVFRVTEGVSPGGRSFAFRNKDFKIDVMINRSLNDIDIPHGAWGIFVPATKVKLIQTQYFVQVRGVTYKFKRYPLHIKAYWRWYDNVCAAVRLISWASIDEELLDYHLRESIHAPAKASK